VKLKISVNTDGTRPDALERHLAAADRDDGVTLLDEPVDVQVTLPTAASLLISPTTVRLGSSRRPCPRRL
jgi:hypothetical protein